LNIVNELLSDREENLIAVNPVRFESIARPSDAAREASSQPLSRSAGVSIELLDYRSPRPTKSMVDATGAERLQSHESKEQKAENEEQKSRKA